MKYQHALAVVALTMIALLSGCARGGGSIDPEYYSVMGRLQAIKAVAVPRWERLQDQYQANEAIDGREAVEVGSLYSAMYVAALSLAADAGRQRYTVSDDTKEAIAYAEKLLAKVSQRPSGGEPKKAPSDKTQSDTSGKPSSESSGRSTSSAASGSLP